MSPTVSVVIVNYNAGRYLAAAVAGVALQAPPVTELIVVDNGSTDGSLAALSEGTDSLPVRVVELGANTGFANGCNVGIAQATGDLVLLLNPDCRMRPAALATLIAALDDRPAAGMAGPRLVNPDGSEQRGARRDVPNPWQIFCFIMQLHKLMPRHPRFRDFNRTGDPLPRRPVAVQAVSGACMLVRRAAIDRIGLLDAERFFLHFEDLDWCLRLTSAGEEVLFVPDAVVEHTQGVCGAKRPVRVEYHKHRSLIRFLRKHFASFYPSSFMAILSILVALRFCAIAARLVVRRPAPAMLELRSVPAGGDKDGLAR
jgi:GT2 family glycosyltransferase